MTTAQWILDARKAKRKRAKLDQPKTRQEQRAYKRSVAQKPKHRKHGRTTS